MRISTREKLILFASFRKAMEDALTSYQYSKSFRKAYTQIEENAIFRSSYKGVEEIDLI